MESEIAVDVDRLDLLVGREAVAKRAGVFDELGHSLTAVELLEDPHDGLTLGLRFGEAHRILQFAFGNINRRLHPSIYDVKSGSGGIASDGTKYSD